MFSSEFVCFFGLLFVLLSVCQLAAFVKYFNEWIAMKF